MYLMHTGKLLWRCKQCCVVMRTWILLSNSNNSFNLIPMPSRNILASLQSVWLLIMHYMPNWKLLPNWISQSNSLSPRKLMPLNRHDRLLISSMLWRLLSISSRSALMHNMSSRCLLSNWLSLPIVLPTWYLQWRDFHWISYWLQSMSC